MTPKPRKSSEVAKAKNRIQALLREIVILRDKGCFLKSYPKAGKCGGYRNDGELILQFDHLNTRARNISFGDAQLGVCVCVRHHIYWKNQYPFEYERCAIDFIGKKREKLLYQVREDRKTYTYGIFEWEKIEMALKQELKKLQALKE